MPYSIDDYKRLGGELVVALYEYCNEESEVHKKLIKELSGNLNLLKTGDKSSCSESNPEEGELKEEEREEIKLMSTGDRSASLPSQKHIRTISTSRERNPMRFGKVPVKETIITTTHSVNPHLEAVLHRKQAQRLIEFRSSMEQL